MEFHCVEDCSDCCIKREYYPSKRFGKIGVLVLPDEKERIEELGKKLAVKITIMPRIGISNPNDKDAEPEVIAYQLMGKDPNGNTCPFLDTKSNSRSPHGGFLCRIYDDRPLACSAFPAIENEPITLDQKCKFCQVCGSKADKNLDTELESLIKIKSKMNVTNSKKQIFRYATGIGEKEDKKQIMIRGWNKEQQR